MGKRREEKEGKEKGGVEGHKQNCFNCVHNICSNDFS